MRIKVLWLGTLVLATAVTAVTCGGGGSSTPTSPSPSPSPTPSPTPSPAPSGGTTLTISSAGSITPKVLTVAAGSRVTFVNNNSRAHDMASDPHPNHTDCPELNQVGFLQPGQSRQTGNLNTRRTCTYHDHDRATDTNVQGTIIIQ